MIDIRIQFKCEKCGRILIYLKDIIAQGGEPCGATDYDSPIVELCDGEFYIDAAFLVRNEK